MIWLIAVAVLGFMLAPLVWIIPTPRQNKQARMRERARQLGLQVRIVTLPQTRRQKVRKEEELPGVCYSLDLAKRSAKPAWRYWFDPQLAAEDDVSLLDDGVLTAISAQQENWPKDARQLEFTGLSFNIYWLERGLDPEAVEKLAVALRGLKEKLGFEQ